MKVTINEVLLNLDKEEGWLQAYEDKFQNDPDYVAELMALGVVEEAIKLLEQRGITRSGLSNLMNVSRAYTSRILNAPPNLTLRSIAQLAIALGTKPHVSIFPTCPENIFRNQLARPLLKSQEDDSQAGLSRNALAPTVMGSVEPMEGATPGQLGNVEYPTAA
jgi:transcriptional regulator with XRE-family HTH domain